MGMKRQLRTQPLARRRWPCNNEIIEVRQIHEMGDFHADVKNEAEGFKELANRVATA